MPALEIPAVPVWQSCKTATKDTQIDRENNVIYGVIAAEEGPFKSQGRGEFDKRAIQAITRLANEKRGGLKARFGHPTMSDDGLGKFVGRFRNARNDVVLRPLEDGTFREVAVSRMDLHIDPTAFSTPHGDLGTYIMDLAESDSDAINTSLVLKVDQELRTDKKGRPEKNDAGEDLPPLWRPKTLHALDIVDTGDATNSFLSVDGLPDELVRKASEMLMGFMPDQPREVVQARLHAYLERFLNFRFGEPEEALAITPGFDIELARLRFKNKVRKG